MQTINLDDWARQYGWDTMYLYKFINLVGSWISKDRKVWLAGGAIRRIITGQDIFEGDFDLFFDSQETYSEVFNTLTKKMGAKPIRETDFNTELSLSDNGITYRVQLIFGQYYKSADELLNTFDFTLCMFAIQLPIVGLSQNEVICGDSSLYDVGRKRIVINNLQNPVPSLRRLIKYTQQGFYACQGCLTEFLQMVVEQPDLLKNPPKYID